MADGGTAWRTQAQGVDLRVRLTPKGGRDAVEGLTDTAEGPAVKGRVRAVPEDGAANAALEALIAGWLGVPKRDVAVIAGHKSRVKTVSIRGDAAVVAARLAAGISDRVAGQGG